MKRKKTFKKYSFLFGFLLFVLSLGGTNAFGALVDEGEAVAVADLWYAMELNSGYTKIDETERTKRLDRLQNRQVLYLVSKDDLRDTPPDKGDVLAYVAKYDPTGFVVVAGEDRIEPVVVFSVKSPFRWDQPQRNFLRYFLGIEMPARWEYLKTQEAKGAQVDVHRNWSYLRAKLQKNIGLQEETYEAPAGTIYVLWDTAAWAQGWPYNETVIANNGSIIILTGCTATAMAIKMRFHEWPETGSGSHSYTDTVTHNGGDVDYSHSVNFGAQSYNWSAMPTGSLTSSNLHVADLMYHCGVAVEMNYERDESSAWPTVSSMNTYFRYKGTIDNSSSHEGPIKDSIRGVLPVVLSSSVHTVVADGYRDTPSPYFHLNCGHSNFGWYNLDQIPGSDSTIDRSYPYCQPNNYIYVDAAWPGAENGNLQTPYNTLSEGESAVPSGGHLWIKAGTYTGAGNVPVTFDKAMAIRTYEGAAVIGDNLLLTASGRIGIYGSGQLKIY